eukprot:Pompholyxophrys_sp_v1_NODE_119_length_1822_cov_1.962649.p1 type:complete len:461 gc:universal NODE_119_length_1822_cov_1.962649:214-1596(+)
MEVKNVQQLTDSNFLRTLKNYAEYQKSPTLLALHEYFRIMRLFFILFDENTISMENKKEYVAEIRTYYHELQNFSTHSKLTANLFFQISTTLDSFISISDNLKKEEILTSSLSTCVVENFFSLIRQKVRYPSLWDYHCIYARAKMENIKRSAPDSSYHYRKNKMIGKKYNNHGLTYTMASIRLLSTTDREKMKGDMKKFQGSEKQRQLCEELVELFRPSRKMLLTREVTCKSNPFEKVKVQVRPNLLCPEAKNGCAHKVFVYPKSFETHLVTAHGKVYTPEQASAATKRAMAESVYSELKISEEIQKSLTNTSPLDELPDATLISERENDSMMIALFLFDLETTGLQTDAAIVEICLRDLINDKLFSSLIFTNKDIDPAAEKIHGITREILEEAPRASDVCERIIDFLSVDSADICLLMSHNSKFDQPKLEKLLSDEGVSIRDNWKFVDTLDFCRHFAPD